MITKAKFYFVSQETGKDSVATIDGQQFYFIINNLRDYNSVCQYLDTHAKITEAKKDE